MIYIALIARITRTSVLEVLNEDYIRTARAKGQAEIKVLMRHALRNAAVPIVTVIGLGVALLIGGVVVTESVFTIPGLGRLTVDAVLARDYPDHPGRDPAVLARLRADQPARRHRATRCSTRGSAIERRGPARRARRDRAAAARRARHGRGMLVRNPSVVIGGDHRRSSWSLIGLAAPLLGTIDPSEINPAFRNKMPGVEQHHPRRRRQRRATFTHRMGTDSLGRDVYSRVVYGARVSLIDRRHGRGRSASRSASSSAWSPATSAGSTASSCA